MKKGIAIVLLAGVGMLSAVDASAMKPISLDTLKAPAGALAKSQPTPSLTQEQQAAIGRRFANLRAAVDRIHFTGAAQALLPAGAIDVILDWQSAGAPDVEIWWDSDTKTPFYIRGNDLRLADPDALMWASTAHDEAAALSTLECASQLTGLTSPEHELRVVSTVRDQIGMRHITYQQVFDGLEVWARNLTVHFGLAGNITSITGRWVPTPVSIEVTNVEVSEDHAIKVAQSHYLPRSKGDVDTTWLCIYVDSSSCPHLAWVCRVRLGAGEAYDVFVSAISGQFLHHRTLIITDGPVVGSGTDLTGATRTVHAYQIGSTYYMLNTTKPMFNPVTGKGIIQIYDYGSGLYPPITSASAVAWGNPAAVSASYNLGLVYDYFLTKHGRNSIDGSGGSLRAAVNDPMPSSAGNNAYFDQGSQAMFFGTGDGTQHSNLAAALDVCAHEMAHGVISKTVGLEYEFQSGALNESFADIFGAMAEFHVLGAAGDWLLGEDVTTPAVPGDALRDMEDPASAKVCCGGEQPTSMSEYQVLPLSIDNGGVHINSGIPNRAFYLIATSIGRDKADSIYYRILAQHYLSSYSQFIDLRLAVIDAADDLYPGNATIASAVTTAFNTVGIGGGPGTQEPGDLPAPMTPQWIIARDEISGRAALFDTAGNFMQYVSSAQVLSKPSAPDSGDVIFFVDHTLNITAVDKNGTWEVQIGDPLVFFNSVSVSPDGELLAYFVVADPVLYVYNLTQSQPEHMWLLYTPTNTGYPSFNVLYPDVLEWSLDGARIVYDCLCYFPNGADTAYYWDIRSIDVSTGLIFRALPTLSSQITIGNPSLGKVHPDLLAFEWLRDDDTVLIYTANLSENSFGGVATNGVFVGRPTFAPDDSRVLFQYNSGSGYNLWRIGYDAESNVTTGSFQLLAIAASFPNWRFEGRDIPSGVFDEETGDGAAPISFTVSQNYPNPFNAGTTITYDIATVAHVRLDVYNVLGQRVFQSDLGEIGAGHHEINWDGKDTYGREVASGVYFYKLTMNKSSQTRKMVILR